MAKKQSITKRDYNAAMKKLYGKSEKTYLPFKYPDDINCISEKELKKSFDVANNVVKKIIDVIVLDKQRSDVCVKKNSAVKRKRYEKAVEYRNEELAFEKQINKKIKELQRLRKKI
jgi:hypothetical protein